MNFVSFEKCLQEIFNSHRVAAILDFSERHRWSNLSTETCLYKTSQILKSNLELKSQLKSKRKRKKNSTIFSPQIFKEQLLDGAVDQKIQYGGNSQKVSFVNETFILFSFSFYYYNYPERKRGFLCPRREGIKREPNTSCLHDMSVTRRKIWLREKSRPIGKFYERGGLLVSLASSANTRKVDIRTIKRSVSL